MSYLEPAYVGSHLTTVGEVVRRGRNLAHLQGEITDQMERKLLTQGVLGPSGKRNQVVLFDYNDGKGLMMAHSFATLMARGLSDFFSGFAQLTASKIETALVALFSKVW